MAAIVAPVISLGPSAQAASYHYAYTDLEEILPPDSWFAFLDNNGSVYFNSINDQTGECRPGYVLNGRTRYLGPFDEPCVFVILNGNSRLVGMVFKNGEYLPVLIQRNAVHRIPLPDGYLDLYPWSVNNKGDIGFDAFSTESGEYVNLLYRNGEF